MLHGRRSNVKQFYRIPAICFRAIHGFVRAPENLALAQVFAPEQGDADAGRTLMHDLAIGAIVILQRNQVRFVCDFPQLFGDLTGLALRGSQIRAQPIENDDEFIATNSRHGVHVANGLRQPVGQIGQEQVSRVVAMGIVQGFEVIQIQR